MSNLEVKRYKLKLLSPLHIGQEDVPSNLLVRLEDEKRIYVLDPLKLSEGLLKIGAGKEQFVRDAVEYIIEGFRKNASANIIEILGRIVRGDKEKLKELVKLSSAYSLEFKNLRNIGERIRTFVRDAYYRPYIPGSSIKGAIRTAFVYKILKEIKVKSPQWYNDKIDREIRSSLENFRNKGERRKKLRDFFGWFEDKLLRIFELILGGEAVNSRQSPHRDIFRCFRVSDTNSIDKDALQLREIKIFSRKRDVGIKIYAEVIPEKLELEFSVTYDWGLLNSFRPTDEPFENYMDFIRGLFEDPIKVTVEFTNDILGHEKEVLGRILPAGMSTLEFEEKPNLIIGYGGGYLSKTIGLLLDETIRSEILNLATRNINRTSPIPSSRKAIHMTDNAMTSIGWCKWEEVM